MGGHSGLLGPTRQCWGLFGLISVLRLLCTGSVRTVQYGGFLKGVRAPPLKGFGVDRRQVCS